MTRCRVCKCSELKACYLICYWVEPDLCSACAAAIAAVARWLVFSHRPSVGALIREARNPTPAVDPTIAITTKRKAS